MNFLVDQDVSPCLKFILDEWGHNAQAVSLRSDLEGEDDRAVLQKAVDENRIVVTFNMNHYESLHEEYREAGLNHAGIIVCTQEQGYARFDRIVSWMRKLLHSVPSSEIPNAIHYLHTF